MAQQNLNLGSVADDGTGDALRTAGDKINDNFTELYSTKLDASAAGTAAAKDTGTGAGQVPLLDGSGLLDIAVLPALAISSVNVVASEVAMLALTAEQGDIAIRTDINKSFALVNNTPTVLANWKELLTPTDTVLAVAGLTGTISAASLKTALGIYSSLTSLHKGGTDQTLTADNTFYKVTWSTAAYDNNSLFDNTNDRITVAVTGKYLIATQISYTTGLAAAELPTIRLYINGAADRLVAVTSPGTSDVTVILTAIKHLTAGDYVEIWAKKNTGSNTKVYGASTFTTLEVAYLGA